MRTSLTCTLAVALLALAAKDGRAEPTLTLSAASTTLNANDTVTIFATLTGLDTANGQTLDYLSADISLPDLVFTATSTPQAGTIVLAASPDGSGFTPSISPTGSHFDVLFSNSFSPIASNGGFFSFTVTAPALSTLKTDPISITSLDYAITNGDYISVSQGQIAALPPLQITINAAPLDVVPEPSTLLMGFIGVALVGGRVVWARRAAAGRPGSQVA